MKAVPTPQEPAHAPSEQPRPLQRHHRGDRRRAEPRDVGTYQEPSVGIIEIFLDVKQREGVRYGLCKLYDTGLG